MKKLTIAIAAASICGGVLAEEAKAPEGVDKEESSVVAGKFGLRMDSRYMTYGCIDGKDPILVPGAKLTFFDWAYAGVESIFDLTKGNGKRGGYGNRAGKYTTIDAMAGLAHEFKFDDGVALSVDMNYMYEYLRRHHSDMGDTQYLNLELSLTGYWVEPTLWIERDLMADEGTYVNLALGHTFSLIDSESEDEDADPLLAFCPSIAQGIGDKHRTRGYDLARDHGGLMDTTIKGELTWTVSENLKLSAYVAYSDYWFDSRLREGARDYNGAWGSSCDHSWNFFGGVAVSVSF